MEFVDNIFDKMSHVINKNDIIFIFVLGDIINRGDTDTEHKYQIAEQVFCKLKSKINAKVINLCFIPGNHDVSSGELTCFDTFIRKFDCNSIEFEKESVFCKNIEGLTFTFADSVTHRGRKNGKIKIDEVKKLQPNILCLHHSIYAQHDWYDFTYDATDIIKLECQFVFHGHTHGASFSKSGSTNIISVGSLLLDYSRPEYKNKSINNQFNLIEIKNKEVLSVNNYRYFGDINIFHPYILYAYEGNKTLVTSLTKILPNDIVFIERKVLLCSKTDEDDFMYSLNYNKSLAEALIDDNLIMLIGEAGIGKSFELKKLHDDNVDSGMFYPLYFSIRDCTLSEIIGKLNSYEQYTNNKRTLFIFDGLDEIQPDKRNELIKTINSYFSKNTNKTVVISTRENFATEIDGFKRYKLLKLTSSDIEDFIVKQGILVDDFNGMITLLQCQSLVKVPFYLTGLINALKKPTIAKTSLMEMLVLERISSDINKYDATIDLKIVKYNLISTLQEIAIMMQLMKEYSLQDEYYQKTFSSDTRKLINYFGAFSFRSDKNVWEFEHNNFREYLTAKYLNQLSFDEIISILVYDENRSKLRPSWLNIVAYLLSMRDDDKLVNWLINNAKYALCDFESDKLTLANRNEIFISVMNDTIRKQLPIFSLYDVSKLGRYFQSDETINYMLGILKTNSNNYAVSSVLHILRCCSNFFGKENDLKTAIIEKPLNNTNYEHIVALSVEVLIRIFTNDLTSITAEIFTILNEDRRPQVFGALCELLVEAKVVDEYIDNIFIALNSDNGLLEDYSSQNGIENVLTNVKSVSGVSNIIKLFCNEELPYELDSKDGIFAHNCERAAELFHQGKIEFLTIMTDCFITMASKCDRKKCQIVKNFFLETKTLQIAFEDMLNRKLRADSMMFTIEDIMDETLEDILITNYLNSDMIDEAFKWYARRLPSNSLTFMKLDDAVLKKDNERIQREPKIDWNENRKESNQKYFNCLFDKNLYSELIDKLLSYIKNNDITCGQLFSFNSSEIYDFSAVPHEREDLQNIRTALYHCKYPTQKVTQFFEYIDWEEFCTREMYRILKNNKNDIEPNAEQIQYIDDYLKTKFAVIDLEDYSEIALDKDNNKYEFIRHIVALAIKIDFSFTDDKLLEMLMLPWYVFDSSTSPGESKTLNFVNERISDADKLKSQIVINIQTKTLDTMAMYTHIIYCHEKGLDYAVNIAKDLLKSQSENAKWRKNIAVDYLIENKGFSYIDNFILQFADDELLKYLATKLTGNNEHFITKLIERNEQSENQDIFLSELIKLNTKYGLQTYFELAKAKNSIPDFSEDESQVVAITEAIRNVNDICLLPELAELIVLCFSSDFKDKSSFGLESGINTAINNIMQVDNEATKEFLDNLLLDNPNNGKILTFCNWHLRDVDRGILVASDRPWGVRETMDFLKEKRNSN